MSYDRTKQPINMKSVINKIVGNGLASPNRYWVSFNLPAGVTPSNFVDNDEGVSEAVKGGAPIGFSRSIGDIGFMCAQMSFPGRSLMTVEHRHVGTPFRMPYSAEYGDVNFTFNLSSDMRERKYFELWQQSIVNVGMNSLNFYKDYVMPVHLMQLDKQGNVTYQVTLVEAYPIRIDDVNNSYASSNEVSQCTVTMAYRHWINEELQ